MHELAAALGTVLENRVFGNDACESKGSAVSYFRNCVSSRDKA